MVEGKPGGGVAWERRFSEFNSGENDVNSLSDLTQAATESLVNLDFAPESAPFCLNAIWGVYSFVRPLLSDLDTKGVTPKGEQVPGAAAFDKRFKAVRDLIDRKLPDAIQDKRDGYSKRFYEIRDALQELFNDVMSARQNQGLGVPASPTRSKERELANEIKG
jgi:hypothetical protein